MQMNGNDRERGNFENSSNDWKDANMNGISDSKLIHGEAMMRLGFIRKVYGILSIQLLITFFFCCLSVISPGWGKFQLEHTALMWLCVIGSIIICIALVCFRDLARKVPLNYFLLLIFTVLEAYLVSTICVTTKPRIVLMAAAMTCGITFSLTLYAWTTKTDFTVFGALFFILSCSMLLFGLFLIFTNNPFLHVLYSTCGVLLYSFYLIYDTQLIVGNHENKLEIDDYIIGALMLYLDIINLFLYLVRLLKSTD